MVLSFGKLMDCEVVTCDYGRDSQGLEPVNIYRVLRWGEAAIRLHSPERIKSIGSL